MLSLLKTKKEDSALLKHAAHLAGRVSKGALTPEAASQARNSCAAPRVGWLSTHAPLTGKSPHAVSELIGKAERTVPPITHLGKFIKKANFQKARGSLPRLPKCNYGQG